MSRSGHRRPIDIEDAIVIGENDHGYQFCVGRIEDRWVGFAAGDVGEGKRMMFLFPDISEGYQLGLPDRDEVIRMTGAIAQDPTSAYGGVARWFVDEALRGDPEDFRCAQCGEVGCRGDHWEPDLDCFDPDCGADG